MFGSWLYGVKKELRSLVLLGEGVMAWSIWLHRNDIVFEKKKNYSPLQVIYVATHQLRS
jgi:4-alpha-glucanotransferase